MVAKRFERELELKLAEVGQPTGRDRLLAAIKGVLNTISSGLGPVVAPFTTGLAEMLDAIPEQAQQSQLNFLRDLGRDVDATDTMFDLERMQDPHYMGIWVKVLKAVQFELHEEKRKAYRGVLLNPLVANPPHPWAQQEFFLSVLDSLGVYAIMALKILHDPMKARREYDADSTRQRRIGPPTFFHIAFVAANENLEQTTFEAVLTDLNSKRLIELEQVSRSPGSVLGTDVQNAARMLTTFGKEFVAFIALPTRSSSNTH
jgi:hypothetical protein